MTEPAGSHSATFFVQIEPEFGRAYGGAEPAISELRAVAITQKRPKNPRSGTVTVELEVRVPDAAFLPLRPRAVIEVPAHLVQQNPVTAEAGDARDPA